MDIYSIYNNNYVWFYCQNNTITLKIKKNVNYYDYKNIFVVGNQKRIEEYYGKGGFDPIENKYGYEYKLERTTCYDEKGEIISINEQTTYKVYF